MSEFEDTSNVLTLDKLNAVVERLHSDPRYFPIRPGSTLIRSPSTTGGLPVVLSENLTVSTPRALSRWERFRVWVEGLADRAEVYYHFPRVQRVEVKPSPDALLIGERLYMHPATWARLRSIGVAP